MSDHNAAFEVGDQIENVVVEMVKGDKKGKDTDVVTGLFLGIVEHRDYKFALLEVGSKICAVNTDVYGVMSIRMQSDKLESLVSFEKGENAEALQELEDLFQLLLDKGFGKSANQIIDSDKYKNVPDEFKLKPNEKPGSIITGNHSAGNVTGFTGCHRPAWQPEMNKYKSSKPEPPNGRFEPFFFKRAQPPGDAVLKEMSEKIEKIRAGDIPVLPHVNELPRYTVADAYDHGLYGY